MRTSHAVAWLACIAGLAALTCASHAQTPDLIVALKFAGFQQTSPTSQHQSGAEFGVLVSFSAAVPGSTSIQLRKPNDTAVTLQRLPDGMYEYFEEFASTAAMEAAFPDGAYRIVAGGASTSFQISTGGVVAPVSITNFDELQGWSAGGPVVRWQPIPGASVNDVLNLTIERESDGEELYATPSSFSPLSTQVFVPDLPAFTPLIGYLSFADLNLVGLANGVTVVATGRGFTVRFPLRRVVLPPTITSHPTSQVTNAGTTARMTAFASGQGPLTYRWMKNGSAIPGASGGNTSNANNVIASGELTLPDVQVTDAGSYTFEVSNAGGTTVSSAAVISVRPSFSNTIYAGVYRSPIGNMSDGPRTTALLAGPGAAVFGAQGDLFFIDRHAIRKVATDGNITTIAGGAEAGSADGTAGSARFNFPSGLAADSAGNLYVADWLNRTVRKVSPAGVVTTLAGSAGEAETMDGVGPAARFGAPYGIALDASGNVYVTDVTAHTLRRITPGGVVTTLAGAANQAGNADGAGAAARFNSPQGIALDPAGTLLVTDGNGSLVRRVTPAGVVTTFYVAEPGAGMNAIAVGADGYVYVSTGRSFRRVAPSGATIGYLSSIYRGVAGADPQSGAIGGLAVDASGNVFAADGINGVIVRAAPAAGSADPGIGFRAQPYSHVVTPGETVVLSTLATGPDVSFQWWKNGSVIAGATQQQLRLSSTSAADAAQYTVVVSNGISFVDSSPASVSFSDTVNVGRLVNLSSRASAGSASQTLIVGFTVGGAGTAGEKEFLFRGIGPGLASFGVGDSLPDPTISLVRDTVTLQTADNWDSSATMAARFRSVGAFPLEPGSRDAASLRSVSSGTYSLLLNGNGGVSGNGMAEIYDAGPAATRGQVRLINLSSRAQVGAGGGVLIAGFSIGGQTSRTVVIRSVGPSLSFYGVDGALADPQMEVYSGDTLIARNDDWGLDAFAAAAMKAAGGFDLRSAKEAALVLTLPPGSYTAVVSGVANTTGVALVELYEVP